jgi:membrane-associated phospholipid phosphatase
MLNNDVQGAGSAWNDVVQSLKRPYKVTLPMVLLVSLVPLYIFIALWIHDRALHLPQLSFDRRIPLQPAWALLYGALYLFLILLPVLLVRHDELIRNAVRAYLFIWITAYAVFIFYPTAAPRPVSVLGEGFSYWGLRFLYSADPPYNCFPSLHVAHSFVSAIVCYRVHRKVGLFTLACALLVGISTLFTKQHYIVDVIAGILLACIAAFIFLRSPVPVEEEHRAAPALAMGTLLAISFGVGCFWIFYVFGGAR